MFHSPVRTTGSTTTGSTSIPKTCIDHILISSHFHYSDEPSACTSIISIQVLALSHSESAGINMEGANLNVTRFYVLGRAGDWYPQIGVGPAVRKDRTRTSGM